ncbi:MAG: HAD-IC family P-type ATPase [Planctomycetales bacterium]
MSELTPSGFTPSDSTPPNSFPWHATATSQVLDTLETSPDGLTAEEVTRRRNKFGPNLLPEKGATPLWVIFLRQFISPLVYILLVAAAVSLIVGEFKDAGFITAVLLINALIGTWQEFQAEQSSLALKQLLRFHALVERHDEIREIDAEQLVPGDIVWLESGNRVPADLRLLSTQGVEIDESLLTGESLAVAKDAPWTGPEKTDLADQINMAFAGSMVTRGRAQGVVVATGLHTQVGQLTQALLETDRGKPPLLIRMEHFTNYVSIGTVAVALVIGLLQVFLWKRAVTDTFFFVVALAVSAIPEGLPVAMTVALAVATTRMARRKVIVRRLTAVEGLGSCTLIATDKTGTLTCNELTVREIRLPDGTQIDISGEGFAPLGEIRQAGELVPPHSLPALEDLITAALLCNEADLHQRDGTWTWHGDAVDVALLSLGHKAHMQREHLLQQFPQVNQIPFEPEHRFAVTFHQQGNEILASAKGAPERLLAMCTESLSAEDLPRLEAIAHDMASRGLRVIALASGTSPPIPPDQAPQPPENLRLLGFVGMIDPLRSTAASAIATCRRAGVDIAMLTGDHRVTALAIAKQIGLAERDDQVLTAAELEGKSPDELVEIVRDTRVFARVTPRRKLEIVRAARAAGHFVAVTGDGVNDAPALRAANISVAMGKGGTDVAREAAELVLGDDNFSSIVAGIEEGRIAYDNIRKVISLLFSMGCAELVMVLLAVITGLPVPLLPVQLLWLNLVTDGIQGVALAFEPGEGDSLQKPPRPPREPIFNRLMVERTGIALFVVGVGSFAVFYAALACGWSLPEARNLTLLTMVLFENFHVGNCRSETKSAFVLSPFRSPILLIGVLAAFAVHLVGMHLPLLQQVLRTHPVSWQTWAIAIAVAFSIIPAIELHKFLWNHPQPS